MDKVIIDTNFLLIPFSFKVDIFSELNRILYKPDLCVLDVSIDELRNISISQSGKDKKYAEMAIFYLQNAPISIIKTAKHLNKPAPLCKINSVDDEIVELAEKGGYLVATQDKLLKEKLKRRKIGIITLRQKKYLVKI